MKETTIIRTPHGKERPYFSMCRTTAQDERLTWEARGVLAYLLSKPSNWRVQVENLQQNCGRDKARNILKELEDHHYLEKIQKRRGDGVFSHNEYRVHEIPFTENPFTENPSTVNPSTDEPSTAEHPRHSIDSTELESNTESRENSVAPSGATGNDQSALEEFIETLDMPEEEKQPEPPPAKVREPNPWYEAAFAVWGFTAARNTGMVNMLQGKAKAKQFKAYNVDPPLESPEKLLTWARWYKWVEQHGESLNMLEDQMKIQSSIGKWRTLGEPDPSAQVFQPTPLFEAVRLHVFGIGDTNARGEQMERITSWLSGELDGGVGKISAPVEPKLVATFAGWYKATYPSASLPRKFETFVNRWREWAQSRKPAVVTKQQKPAAQQVRKPTAEEWRAANEKSKTDKQLEPAL